LLILAMTSSCGGGGNTTNRTIPPPALNSVVISPTAPWANSSVSFSAQCASTEPLTYQWDFGDGSTASTANAQHAYSQGGTYQASFTCTSKSGLQSRDPFSLVVSQYDLTSVAGDVCSNGNTGGGWCWQSPLPSGARIFAIQAVDRHTIWATGSGGSIIRSLDGGATWSAVPTGSNQDLVALSVVDLQTLWAAGNDGTVVTSVDGGTSWTAQSAPFPAPYSNAEVVALAAADKQTAYACTTTTGIYKTTNGGHAWAAAVPNAGCTALSLVSQSVVWAAGSQASGTTTTGVAWRTTDGNTWTPLTVTGLSSTQLTSVAALDANNAWVIAGGQVARTADGGNTWAVAPGVNYYPFEQLAVVAGDATDAWILDQVATLYHATYAGGAVTVSTIGPVPAPVPSAYFSLFALDPNTLWLSGYGVISTTSNGGQSWHVVASVGPPVSQIFAVDSDTAWSVTAGGIQRTGNGGVTWEPVSFPQLGAGYSVNPGFFLAPADGFNAALIQIAVPIQTGPATTPLAIISQTVDGGALWSSDGIAQPAYGVFATSYGSTTWAFVSTNPDPQGGQPQTWDVYSIVFGGGVFFTETPVTSLAADITPGPGTVFATDASTVWVCGVGRKGSPLNSVGAVFRSVDGGQSWQQSIPSPTGAKLVAIAPINDNVAWAASSKSVFLTQDGGTTWTDVGVPMQGFGGITAINAVDSNTVWVAGTDASGVAPYIWLGTPPAGGSTWNWTEQNIFGASLVSIASVNDGTDKIVWSVGTIGGDQFVGAILKTVTGGQ
jgi:photosystem II stability/assembly factor-like uncharacterized protein